MKGPVHAPVRTPGLTRSSILWLLLVVQALCLAALFGCFSAGGRTLPGGVALTAASADVPLLVLFGTALATVILLLRAAQREPEFWSGPVRMDWPAAAVITAAVLQRFFLAIRSPQPFGYVWDYYHRPILMYYTKGMLPESIDCWECYHPPLFTIIGKNVYALGMLASGGDVVFSQKMVSLISMAASVAFIYLSCAIIRIYVDDGGHRRLLAALALALPCLFISSFAIEADLLCSTLMIAALYCFLRYLRAPADKGRIALALLAGGFAGLSASTKYTGLISIVALTVMFGLSFIAAGGSRKILRHFLLFILAAALLGSWKYTDNYWKYGKFITGNWAWEHIEAGDEKKYFFDEYEFTTFRLGEFIELMSPGSPNRELKKFRSFDESILTSLHGQTWTDASMFSNPSRHGLATGLYPTKRIPFAVISSVLTLGLFPVLLALFGGLLLKDRLSALYPLVIFTFTGLAIYAKWFLGFHEWMLKTKYLLFLLPCYLVFVGLGLEFVRRRSRRAGWLSAMLLAALVLAANAYDFFFALM